MRQAITPWVLGVVLFLLAARLAGFVGTFTGESLQMDFAAYYTAGRTLSAGLDPYVNYVARRPELWDGVAGFAHSRFLYPPLTARLFQPLASLPYTAAKALWTLGQLACIALALGLWARSLGLGRRLRELLALTAIAAGFYPLLTLLERGQVDGLVLLLLTLGLLGAHSPRRAAPAGALLAASVLFKPYCVVLVLFLALRGRWRAVAGFGAGGLLLLGAGLLLDGPPVLRDYAQVQLPRISRYGEGGTRAMALPQSSFAVARSGVEAGRTALDGRTYLPQSLRFVLNASLIPSPVGRALQLAGRRLGLPLQATQLSLFLFAVALGGLFLANARWGPPAQCAAADGIFWNTVIVVLLLCAPVSWAMGVVWLLPLAALLISERHSATTGPGRVPFALCLAGLIVAGLPDFWEHRALLPVPETWLLQKYVVAELLCLIGLLGLWRSRARLPRPENTPG